VLTVFGCTCLGASSAKKTANTEEYKRQLRKVDLAKLTEQERVLLAQFTIQGLQSTLQNTQQALDTLLQQAQTFEQRKAALMDSDEGKRVAVNDLTLRRFNRLDENPAVSVPEITANVEAASALAAIVQVSADRPEVGHIPSPATETKVHDLSFWAKDRLARLQEQQSELNSILRDAISDVDVSKRPSLKAALEQHRSAWPKFMIEAETTGEALATDEAQKVLVDAKRLAILEKAQARVDEIMRKNQAEIAALKTQMEVELLKRQVEADRLLAAARADLEKAQSEIRELQKNVTVDIQIKEDNEEAKRKEKLEQLRQRQLEIKAESPRVRQVLAPFITPGYWQPGSNKPTYDRQPVSLKQLKSRKALENTSDGLKALLKIGIDDSDKVRPRWGWSMYIARLSPTQMDELREAQQYLIELGEVLVKKGMLAP